MRYNSHPFHSTRLEKQLFWRELSFCKKVADYKDVKPVSLLLILGHWTQCPEYDLESPEPNVRNKMISSLSSIKHTVVIWNGTRVSTDLVHVEEREEFLDFLRPDQVLLSHVPVGAGHLILHLIHSSRSGSDPDAARLVEPHCLQMEGLE